MRAFWVTIIIATLFSFAAGLYLGISPLITRFWNQKQNQVTVIGIAAPWSESLLEKELKEYEAKKKIKIKWTAYKPDESFDDVIAQNLDLIYTLQPYVQEPALSYLAGIPKECAGLAEHVHADFKYFDRKTESPIMLPLHWRRLSVQQKNLLVLGGFVTLRTSQHLIEICDFLTFVTMPDIAEKLTTALGFSSTLKTLEQSKTLAPNLKASNFRSSSLLNITLAPQQNNMPELKAPLAEIFSFTQP